MITFDRSEALRYLGYRGTEPDAAVEESLVRCAEGLQDVVQPQSVFRRFPLRHPAENMLDVAGVAIHSNHLARNLKDCTDVYLMAATLGIRGGPADCPCICRAHERRGDLSSCRRRDD